MVVIVMMMFFVFLMLLVFRRFGRTRWMVMTVVVIVVGRILPFHTPVAAHRSAGRKSQGRGDNQRKASGCDFVDS